MSAHARCLWTKEFVKILKPMIFSDGRNASSPGPSKYLEKQICLLKYGWRARCVCVCFNARRFKNEYLAKFVFLQTGVKNQGSDRHVFGSPGPCSEGKSHLSQLKICVVCCGSIVTWGTIMMSRVKLFVNYCWPKWILIRGYWAVTFKILGRTIKTHIHNTPWVDGGCAVKERQETPSWNSMPSLLC